MVVVSIMNNEIELIRTIDHSFKDEIIKVFVKERISYLQKSKYVIFLKKCMTGNKEIYVTEILRQYFINHPQSIDKYTFLQNSAFTHWVKEKCSKMC